MTFNHSRNLIMKRSNKIAAVIVASLGMSLSVATAYAHGPMGEGMGGGMGHGAMMSNMSQGMGQGGMGHGAMAGGMGHGMQGGQAGGQMGGQQLMTPEEQTALRDKMSAAATPEERQQIAAANRAEMQKRAKEKSITLPEGRGPRPGAGPSTESHRH